MADYLLLLYTAYCTPFKYACFSFTLIYGLCLFHAFNSPLIFHIHYIPADYIPLRYDWFSVTLIYGLFHFHNL